MCVIKKRFAMALIGGQYSQEVDSIPLGEVSGGQYSLPHRPHHTYSFLVLDRSAAISAIFRK